MQNSLFEGIKPLKVKVITRSKYQQWKVENNYRKADKGSEINCKNCIHCFKSSPSIRTYYKCELLGISACSATDIRISSVCNLFESEDKKCAKEL